MKKEQFSHISRKNDVFSKSPTINNAEILNKSAFYPTYCEMGGITQTNKNVPRQGDETV